MKPRELEGYISLARSVFFAFLAYLYERAILPESFKVPLALYGIALFFFLFLPYQPPISSFFYCAVDALLGAVCIHLLRKLNVEPDLPLVSVTFFFLAMTLSSLPWRFGSQGLLFSFGAASLSFFGAVLSLPVFSFFSAETLLFLLLMLALSFAHNMPLARENKKLKEKIKEQEKELAQWKKKVETVQQDARKERVRDQATGCFNEKYFLMKLQEEFPKAKRHKFPITVCAIGVDRFQQFKEMYDDKKGKEALRTIGMLLSAYTRDSDMLCRLTNKEIFLTLFPFTAKENAKIPIQRFAEAVSQYRFDDRDPNVRLTVSCGIAEFAVDAENEEGLIQCALQALKQARALGGSKIVLFR